MRSTIRQVLALPLLVFCSLAYGDVRIASWNVENLGWNNDKSIHAVARVASQYDFLAIQEVMRPETVEDLAEQLSDKTGERWGAIYSEAIGRGAYREHYAFLWRQEAIEYVGRAVVYLDDRDLFVREPFSARFLVRETGMVFAAATIHVVFGERISDRTPEIQALAKYWRWLEEIYPKDRDRIVLLGDFNLHPTHQAWYPIVEIAEPQITEGATTLSPQDRKYANLYDNILLARDHGFGHIVTGIHAFPEALTETDDRYWSHRAARNYVSDHAPVYLFVGSIEAHSMRSGRIRVSNWQSDQSVNMEKPKEDTCLDLNMAPPNELERIPYIGPERANDLVDGRPWGEISQLVRILGISSARISEIEASGVICE